MLWQEGHLMMFPWASFGFSAFLTAALLLLPLPLPAPLLAPPPRAPCPGLLQPLDMKTPSIRSSCIAVNASSLMAGLALAWLPFLRYLESPFLACFYTPSLFSKSIPVSTSFMSWFYRPALCSSFRPFTFRGRSIP